MKKILGFIFLGGKRGDKGGGRGGRRGREEEPLLVSLRTQGELRKGAREKNQLKKTQDHAVTKPIIKRVTGIDTTSS